jgi:hypothetical protein
MPMHCGHCQRWRSRICWLRAGYASLTTKETKAITQECQLDVELQRPADLPAFILVKWPVAPSIGRAAGRS